ncbi:MAG: hypothetical protein ABJH06_16615 [Paraglaciecola sp.]|uniref:hypothetical protein n=1 Tax=Paraglaciecola sp. TaxID=1920173 RepID=UPI00329A6CC8
MKRRSKEINVFSMSALDLFASALGAFIIIALVTLPYFPNKSKLEPIVPSVEVVFVLDFSGSMQDKKNIMLDELDGLSDILGTFFESVNMGVVFYQDKGMLNPKGSNVALFNPVDITQNANKIALKAWLSGNSDFEFSGSNKFEGEDLYAAINTATSDKLWGDGDFKLIVAMTDDFAHVGHQSPISQKIAAFTGNDGYFRFLLWNLERTDDSRAGTTVADYYKKLSRPPFVDMLDGETNNLTQTFLKIIIDSGVYKKKVAAK